jgi:hypothetical protein
LAHNNRIMARNKCDKDYAKSEKQFLISLLNNYTLFGAPDHEIIQILYNKISEKYSRYPSLKERYNN